MSKLTDFISDVLVQPAWDKWEVVEPTEDQLITLKYLINDTLDRLRFPHCYEGDEE